MTHLPSLLLKELIFDFYLRTILEIFEQITNELKSDVKSITAIKEDVDSLRTSCHKKVYLVGIMLTISSIAQEMDGIQRVVYNFIMLIMALHRDTCAVTMQCTWNTSMYSEFSKRRVM